MAMESPPNAKQPNAGSPPDTCLLSAAVSDQELRTALNALTVALSEPTCAHCCCGCKKPGNVGGENDADAATGIGVLNLAPPHMPSSTAKEKSYF